MSITLRSVKKTQQAKQRRYVAIGLKELTLVNRGAEIVSDHYHVMPSNVELFLSGLDEASPERGQEKRGSSSRSQS